MTSLAKLRLRGVIPCEVARWYFGCSLSCPHSLLQEAPAICTNDRDNTPNSTGIRCSRPTTVARQAQKPDPLTTPRTGHFDAGRPELRPPGDLIWVLGVSLACGSVWVGEPSRADMNRHPRRMLRAFGVKSWTASGPRRDPDVHGGGSSTVENEEAREAKRGC